MGLGGVRQRFAGRGDQMVNQDARARTHLDIDETVMMSALSQRYHRPSRGNQPRHEGGARG